MSKLRVIDSSLSGFARNEVWILDVVIGLASLFVRQIRTLKVLSRMDVFKTQ